MSRNGMNDTELQKLVGLLALLRTVLSLSIRAGVALLEDEHITLVCFVSLAQSVHHSGMVADFGSNVCKCYGSTGQPAKRRGVICCPWNG